VERAIVDADTLPALESVEPHVTRHEIERRWAEGQRCHLYRLVTIAGLHQAAAAGCRRWVASVAE
jgi:hypothetical protein